MLAGMDPAIETKFPFNFITEKGKREKKEKGNIRWIHTFLLSSDNPIRRPRCQRTDKTGMARIRDRREGRGKRAVSLVIR